MATRAKMYTEIWSRDLEITPEGVIWGGSKKTFHIEDQYNGLSNRELPKRVLISFLCVSSEIP